MPTPAAFTRVWIFDALEGRFVEGQTVVAAAGKIVAVGRPAACRYRRAPHDGRGTTLTPGIWDAHLRAGSDLRGVMLLSLGEISARDPGAELRPALHRKLCIANGGLLSPRCISRRSTARSRWPRRAA